MEKEEVDRKWLDGVKLNTKTTVTKILNRLGAGGFELVSRVLMVGSPDRPSHHRLLKRPNRLPYLLHHYH